VPPVLAFQSPMTSDAAPSSDNCAPDAVSAHVSTEGEAEDYTTRCSEIKIMADAAFARFTEMLVHNPSEAHAKHLLRFTEKMERISTAGQAMEALLGATAGVSRRLRCGGRCFLTVAFFVVHKNVADQ
jgi:hypothetical protein